MTTPSSSLPTVPVGGWPFDTPPLGAPPAAPSAPSAPSPCGPRQDAPVPGEDRFDQSLADGQVPLLSCAEFYALAASERQGWFWEGILPGSGVVLLAGEPRVGKTVLAALIVGAASTGGMVLDRRVGQRRVLYFHLEHNRRDLAAKLQAVEKQLRITGLDVHVGLSLDLDDEEQVNALASKADQLGVGVIIIDTIRRATRISENVPEHVAELGRRLRLLTGGGKRLVLVLHHFNKSGQIRGTTDFAAAADSTVELHRQGPGVLLHAGHHDAEDIKILYRAEFSKEEGTLFATVLENRATPAGSSIAVSRDLAVLSMLGRRPSKITPLREDLRSEANIKFGNGRLGPLLDRLLGQGLVTKQGHIWSITQAGQQFLQNSSPAPAVRIGGDLSTSSSSAPTQQHEEEDDGDGA
jgi:DNA-binding PadR family transcriptional regulator/archaellum biogenesis ATPase FlaH